MKLQYPMYTEIPDYVDLESDYDNQYINTPTGNYNKVCNVICITTICFMIGIITLIILL